MRKTSTPKQSGVAYPPPAAPPARLTNYIGTPPVFASELLSQAQRCKRLACTAGHDQLAAIMGSKTSQGFFDSLRLVFTRLESFLTLQFHLDF